MGLIRDRQGNYKFTGSTTEHDVLSAAEQILRTKLERQGVIGDPRETVRAALEINASAALLSHNHPSGVAEPSTADRAITQELIAALKLVGVRVLDHIVVAAGETVSMAGRGLM